MIFFGWPSNYSKSLIFVPKFNFLKLFRIQYSRKSSNFGAKIQICLKLKILSKLIFGTKIRTFRLVCMTNQRISLIIHPFSPIQASSKTRRILSQIFVVLQKNPSIGTNYWLISWIHKK